MQLHLPDALHRTSNSYFGSIVLACTRAYSYSIVEIHVHRLLLNQTKERDGRNYSKSNKREKAAEMEGTIVCSR